MLIRVLENGSVQACAVVTGQFIFIVRKVESACQRVSDRFDQEPKRCRRPLSLCSATQCAPPLKPALTLPQFFLWSGLSRLPSVNACTICPQLFLEFNVSKREPLRDASQLIPLPTEPQFFLSSGLARSPQLLPAELYNQFLLCAALRLTCK